MAVIEQIPNLDELFKGRIDGEVVNQTAKRLTESGENYLSLILKLDVQVKNADDDKEDNVETVIKLVPPSRIKSRKLSFSHVAFNNEIVWYNEVVPVLEEFEKSHGVSGFTDFYPKYYGGRLSLNPEVNNLDENAAVVLEFLNDYKNADRFKGFNLAEAKDVIVALARFHTLTIAIKELNPELFDAKIKPNIDKRIDISEEYFDVKEFIKEVREVVQELGEISEEVIDRAEKLLLKDPFAKTDYREPWATTVHSDFWVNNIMIHKNRAVDVAPVKIVDFQMVLYHSFATDLMFFLLLSVENSVIRFHLDFLIDYYYENFINNLKKFNVDTSKFTYEDYLEEIKLTLTRDNQFVHVLIFCNFVFREKGDGPDLILEGNEESMKNVFHMKKSTTYKEKVWEVYRTCARKNWI